MRKKTEGNIEANTNLYNPSNSEHLILYRDTRDQLDDTTNNGEESVFIQSTALKESQSNFSNFYDKYRNLRKISIQRTMQRSKKS